ncbi:MAG: transposase [Firmicutes bacterium]|nr:transposase [Bacillota bacterium]
MPRSKYRLYIHLIWAAKKREPFITLELESIIQNIFREKCQQFSIEMCYFGNIEDHGHLLLPETVTEEP